MIVQSGVAVSCPVGSKEKGLTLSCKSLWLPELGTAKLPSVIL